MKAVARYVNVAIGVIILAGLVASLNLPLPWWRPCALLEPQRGSSPQPKVVGARGHYFGLTAQSLSQR